MLSALVSTLTEAYCDLTKPGRAALEMTAHRNGIELSRGQQQGILGTLRKLPPHADVEDGISRLRESGFRMAALTNSTAEVTEAQLAHTGLRRLAGQRLGVQPVEIHMLAAPAWAAHCCRKRAGCVRRLTFDGAKVRHIGQRDGEAARWAERLTRRDARRRGRFDV